MKRPGRRVAEVELSVEARGPVRAHVFDAARDLGVDLFVTDRAGGVSAGPYASLNLGDHVGDDVGAVTENRRRVARAAGVPLDALIVVRQVHGSDILDAAAVTPDSEADGLVTTATTLALAVLVADCVPVALVEAPGRRVALVHAGWRGLAGGVIARAVAAFDTGASLHAFVGPCVSGRAYQVGPEVASRFADVAGAVTPDVGDRSRLDLRHVASAQLLDAGVHAESLHLSRAVTDGGGTFFSDRAQRPCGRFALVARRTRDLA